MKRLRILLPTLLFVAIMAGCGQTPKTQDEISIIAMNSMYNEKTGQTVSLDMDQDTIEEQLGKGTEHELALFGADTTLIPYTVISDVQYISYGTGEDFIVVTYQGDTPTAISSCGNFSNVKPGPSHWSIKYGLSYGASMNDIVANYGAGETLPLAPTQESAKTGEGYLNTPSANWEAPILVSYYYDKDYNPLNDVADENVLYQLTFIVDEKQDGLMWYTVSYGVNVPISDK